MYQRILPLLLTHLTFTVLCGVASYVTQTHSVWGLLTSFVWSHAATGVLVTMYVSEREDDLSEEKLLSARPYIINFLLASIIGLVCTGLTGAIVISCNSAVSATALIVLEPYAGEVREEWITKQPTVALFLSLVSLVFLVHLASIIWASVQVRRANVLMRTTLKL